MSIIRTSAVIWACSLAACMAAHAQTTYKSQAAGTSIKITGTSTLHDWEMESKNIGGTIEFPPGMTLDKSQAAPAGMQGDKLTVKSRVLVAVAGFHSKAEHLPEVMDDLMKKNMKESDFHVVEFKLAELKFKGPHEAGKPFDFEAKGALTIAGQTKPVTFPITIEPEAEGKLRVTGTAAVKMTDFGVEPPTPTLSMGAMKCGDDVKIIFDWMLKEKK